MLGRPQSSKSSWVRTSHLSLLLLGSISSHSTLLGKNDGKLSYCSDFDLWMIPPFCRFKLNIWDVGGQKTIRSYWRNYFEQTDGLIWVVDSADRRRLNDCREEFMKLLSQEKLSGASVLIFANKQDLAGALTIEEIVEVLDLKAEQFKKRHWQVGGCSAVSGAGLIDGMNWLIDDIKSRIYLGD